jgi:hypothetical protein
MLTTTTKRNPGPTNSETPPSTHDPHLDHLRRLWRRMAAMLPLGSAGFEPEPDAKGERYVWLEEGWVNKLGAMRGPGESYSDVILRLVTARSSE